MKTLLLGVLFTTIWQISSATAGGIQVYVNTGGRAYCPPRPPVCYRPAPVVCYRPAPVYYGYTTYPAYSYGPTIIRYSTQSRACASSARSITVPAPVQTLQSPRIITTGPAYTWKR